MSLNTIFKLPLVDRLGRGALLRMEPETAHRATLNALRYGAVPKGAPAPETLATRILGLKLDNPVGMAAGFDKNAEVPDALIEAGLGFVEVGTVTPRPQAGNAAPRVFRLAHAQAIINRLGFNNEGHAMIHARVARRARKGIVGINIGANRDSEDFLADYVAGVARFCALADYLTANVSSPNTPGLRDLQASDPLKRLVEAMIKERARQGAAVPIMLKIAPDLEEAHMDAIARVVRETGVDGLIVSNSTTTRPDVAGDPLAQEAGGLSGPPLFDLATRRLAQMRQRVGPDLPIIGVGGVHSAQSAIAKFEAGANAIQLYSALVFGGLGLVQDILAGLAQAVETRGLASVGELTGSRVDAWAEAEPQAEPAG